MANETPRIQAEPRDRTGSRYARRLRRSGKLPAVIYGHGETPQAVAVSEEEVLHHLHDGAHLLEVQQNGKSQTCLIKDVQYDYLGTNVIHVDLTRIDMTEEVELTVPIELVGQDDAPGLKEAGAYLDQSLVDLDVRCRATNIPDSITVDVSTLGVTDSILVGDLTLPNGVETDHNPEDVVVSVGYVAEEPEEEEAVAEAEGEPEVIGEAEQEEGAEGGGESKEEG